MNAPADIAVYMTGLGRAARQASVRMAKAGTHEKDAALIALAQGLRAQTAELMQAIEDYQAGRF